MMALSLLLWVAFVAPGVVGQRDLPPLPMGYNAPGLPVGPPQPAPSYMVDNTRNEHNSAPDKGTLNKPIVSEQQSAAFHRQQSNARGDPLVFHHEPPRGEAGGNAVFGPGIEEKRGGSHWLENISHGEMPFAPKGYQFFRNVKDFGAVGDGETDDTAAINRAASYLSINDSTERCGSKCGQTTTLGALVYFPPGTYLITSPIIQYYYTQFVGDAANKPTIEGAQHFKGIALIDCDPYVPDGNGANWYIDQNQFFRQIRNFRLDLTAMNHTNYDHSQEYVPTGIHWQVSQAASLQYIDFFMPISDASGSTTAVGIFMENGSGGFMSDLTFSGGNIGFRAGSQQYTARNLQFTSCLTAISLIWDWGFTLQNINVLRCYVAIDCTNIGGIGGQGTGSITIIDSHFNGVPYAITLRNNGSSPNIVLDNLLVENSASVVVVVSEGETIFPGSTGQIFFTSWAMGRRCISVDGSCSYETGLLNPAPRKPASLLDSSGSIFARSKPAYASLEQESFLVATTEGIKNDATGDQSGAINILLKQAAEAGRPVFFPAGVYLVEKTVFVPVGSVIIGEGWSQIMGTGKFFSDEKSPKPVIRVGNPGDSGIIELSDMLWTVRGATAGAILMEWNVHESTKGSAAMWDCHFRVGGAVGSNLRVSDCPKSTSDVNRDCMAASMLLHVTPKASGYFENVWVWTADHDMDLPWQDVVNGNTANASEINVYTARGILIESQGPTWLYGTGSEHHTLYQYQILNAKDVFMTHIQTETPYFQASPDASQPYQIGRWSGDPKFGDCGPDTNCKKAWGLRVLGSRNVLIYSAGLYSFFHAYDSACRDDESCQERMIETSYSEGLWIYNIFTKGTIQVVSPRGGLVPLLQGDTLQAGYTTEVSAWLVLALDGGDLGGDGGDSTSGSDLVYIDPGIFLTPSPTVQCWPPCTLVLPPSTLASPTVISLDPIETFLVVGGETITSIIVSAITTTVISYGNLLIPQYETSFTFAVPTRIVPSPVVTTINGITTTISLPPLTTVGPTASTRAETLPTTVITEDGTVWTYSMDQITQMRSNTVRTSSTTTSNNTMIPLWIDIGGFYWSPVPSSIPTPPPGPPPGPLPVPLPVPRPPLPEAIRFPPIPTPPCFKIFGIFSVMCPPDMSLPTTTFIIGPQKPSCKSRCGVQDKEGDHPTSSTSTCLTATSKDCYTVCRRKPCETVCNTYVGCSCPTNTVTDYWVSCSSTSCITTRRQTVTGCYAKGTATTTGDYCPVGTLDPNEPQGIDGTAQIGTVTTVTRPAKVLIGSSMYTVTSGSIWMSGSGFQVPTEDLVTTDLTATIQGQPAVIFPPSATRKIVITASEFMPTATGSGPGQPAPKPTAYLDIAFGIQTEVNSSTELYWSFYSGLKGQLYYNVCDPWKMYRVNQSDPYPPGEFELPRMLGTEGCIYTGTSDAPGFLTCPDLTTPVQCVDIEYAVLCLWSPGPITMFDRVRCEWGSAPGFDGSLLESLCGDGEDIT